MEQGDALRRFEDELEAVKSEKEGSNADDSPILSRYAQMDEIAGLIKNSFQNAYTFFLSDLIYELLKRPNDAYINYKKALGIFPQNTYLQKDVFRLAGALNIKEEQRASPKRFDISALANKYKSKSTNGELIIIFEDNFVPQKQELRIPLIPSPNNNPPKTGRIDIAVPIYKKIICNNSSNRQRWRYGNRLN